MVVNRDRTQGGETHRAHHEQVPRAIGLNVCRGSENIAGFAFSRHEAMECSAPEVNPPQSAITDGETNH